MLNNLKTVFWLLGFLLLVFAVQSVDIKSVTILLTKMKWGLLIVLSIYILINFADAAAWKYALKPDEAKTITLGQMWRIRQIGEAFNMATPLGTMGGEPLKAELLKEVYRLNMKQTVSSLVVSRTTNLLGLISFFLIGAVFIWRAPGIDSTFKTTSFIGLTVFSILILLFLFFQIHGGLKIISNWFAKFPLGKPIRHALKELETLSHHMANYYNENPIRCLESIWYAFVGWVLGVAELYLTLYFLGENLSLTDVWIIEALIQLIKVGSFFIPLNLGALESGMVIIFASMGMSTNLGMAASVVRRIKELVWIALGLGMSTSMVSKSFKGKPRRK